MSEKSDLAEPFAVKLSDVYRFLMGNIGRNSIPLNREIENARNYVELMKVRMPDSIIADFSPSLSGCVGLVVPLCVQTLIENAIKHNAHTLEKPLHITVRKDGNFVVVENEIHPTSIVASKESGIGLKNLNGRYTLLFGKGIKVDAGDDKFIVKLPIVQRHAYIDN